MSNMSARRVKRRMLSSTLAAFLALPISPTMAQTNAQSAGKSPSKPQSAEKGGKPAKSPAEAPVSRAAGQDPRGGLIQRGPNEAAAIAINGSGQAGLTAASLEVAPGMNPDDLKSLLAQTPNLRDLNVLVDGMHLILLGPSDAVQAATILLQAKKALVSTTETANEFIDLLALDFKAPGRLDTELKYFVPNLKYLIVSKDKVATNLFIAGSAADIVVARKLVDALSKAVDKKPPADKVKYVYPLQYLSPADAVTALGAVADSVAVTQAVPTAPTTIKGTPPFALATGILVDGKSDKSSSDADTTTNPSGSDGAGKANTAPGSVTPLTASPASGASRLFDGTAAPSAEKKLPLIHQMNAPTYAGIPHSMVASADTTHASQLGVPSLILTGTSDDLADAVNLLEQVDVAPPQVIIEVRVLETSPEDAENLGIQWADPSGFLTSTGLKETPPPTNNVIRFGTFKRDGINFTANVSALQRRGKARLLASPTISVVNGQEATIFSGQQVQYLQYKDLDVNGRSTFQLATQKVGVSLIVKPTVHLGDNEITMKLVPSVSALLGLNNGVPNVQVQSTDTTIRLHDGDLLAIGGLINDQETTVRESIPILGDIPLIGNLFQHRNHSRQRTELTFILSPRIVRKNDPITQPIFNQNPPPQLPKSTPIPADKNGPNTLDSIPEVTIDALGIDPLQVVGSETLTGIVTFNRRPPKSMPVMLQISSDRRDVIDDQMVSVNFTDLLHGNFSLTTTAPQKSADVTISVKYGDSVQKSKIHVDPKP